MVGGAVIPARWEKERKGLQQSRSVCHRGLLGGLRILAGVCNGAFYVAMGPVAFVHEGS
jgi:hypothetical protein